MKRTYAILLATVLAITALLIPVTVAWLGDNGLSSDISVTSHVHKSYFESGTGTSSDPYIIKYPIQLYHLAWLQEMGYFNDSLDDDSIPTTYFKLSDDIKEKDDVQPGEPYGLDMSEYTLPAIGTQQYPFLGNFDGNGKTIRNLTIENNIQEMTDAPVTELDGVDIIGFFGVVGKLEGDYTYDTIANAITNFTLDTITVKTETEQSLIGVVAGYVNGNVSNVKVSGTAKIERTEGVTAIHDEETEEPVFTENLSDYSLIGYTTRLSSGDVVNAKVSKPIEKTSIYNYEAPGGEDAGWGGSVDMKALYDRIADVRKNKLSSGAEYISAESRLYDEDGNYLGIAATSKSTNRNFRMHTVYTSEDIINKNYDNTSSGNYVLSYENNNSAYHYLTALSKKITNFKRKTKEDGFTIKSGNVFLNISDDYKSITSSGNGTIWVLDTNNYLRTIVFSGEGWTYYYLNADVSGNLTISTTASTQWNKTSDAIYCIVNGTNNYLMYNENTWMACSLSRYTISVVHKSNTYYLNATSNSGIGTGSANNTLKNGENTLWYFSNPGTNPSGTISCLFNGKRYFLVIDGITDIDASIKLDDEAISWKNSSNCLQQDARRDWWIGYNTNIMGNFSSWYRRENEKNKVTLTFTPYSITRTSLTFADADDSAPETWTYTDNPIINYEPSETAWIPLKASKTQPYKVFNSSNDGYNTGYIVSGNYETNDDDKVADIRISKYGVSNISGSYSNNKINLVRTIVKGQDGNYVNSTVNGNEMRKYSASLTQMQALLNDRNVYGLHFMNAQLSTEHIITVPSVTMNGKTYENYQLPQDCIDFKVPDKGYINFFAGTFYEGNDSFFSLNRVIRDQNNNITDIKEIKQIFKSSDKKEPYIYKYSDGSFSDSLSSNYSNTPIFDTTCITNPGVNIYDEGRWSNTCYLYYFEIPVNGGDDFEYALGSVSGHDGAYLLYLDIASNSQLVDRATIIENFKVTTDTYRFPAGVTYSNTATNVYAPSVLVSMPADVESNLIEATVTENTETGQTNIKLVGLDKTQEGITNTFSYIDNGVVLIDEDDESLSVTIKKEGTTTTRIRRTTYYDHYKSKTPRYNVTVIETKQVDEESKSVTINSWDTAADWDISNTSTATRIANMSTGFTPEIEADTDNVEINSGVKQKMEYNSADHSYKIATGADATDSILRLDADAFEGELWDGEEPLYSFGYSIPDNSNSTIDYVYTFTMTDNPFGDDEHIYEFSERRYDINVITDIAVIIVPKQDIPTGYTVNITNNGN